MITTPRRPHRTPTSAARSALALATVAGFALLVAGCSGDDDSAMDSLPSATGTATAGSQDLRVEFTGDACVYSGPTEFKLGDSFDVTAIDTTEERASVGYSVEKVVDGTTVADAQKEGFEQFLDGDSGTYLYANRTQEGTQRSLSTPLDVPGTWLLHCFVSSTADPGWDWYYATTFEVVE